jgi:hypothetical protein
VRRLIAGIVRGYSKLEWSPLGLPASRRPALAATPQIPTPWPFVRWPRTIRWWSSSEHPSVAARTSATGSWRSEDLREPGFGSRSVFECENGVGRRPPQHIEDRLKTTIGAPASRLSACGCRCAVKASSRWQGEPKSGNTAASSSYTDVASAWRSQIEVGDVAIQMFC